MKQLVPVFILIMMALRQAQGDSLQQDQDKPTTFYIRFQHMAGDRALELFNVSYRNDWGEPFTVRQLKYYIHDLSFMDDKGVRYTAPQAYYLVDEADSGSATIRVPAPAGAVVSVHFIIGVDSIDNTSGAQSGALDPVKGMFWTWNSGYIFAKLEGRSDSSHAPGHYFSYHVGGFKQARNALRVINLPVALPNPHLSVLVIQADILAWFHGAHRIPIAQSPVCHEPGPMALELADNYSSMFRIAAGP